MIRFKFFAPDGDPQWETFMRLGSYKAARAEACRLAGQRGQRIAVTGGGCFEFVAVPAMLGQVLAAMADGPQSDWSLT